MEGWLVAGGIFLILWWFIRRTKLQNFDPEMREIASVMEGCARGYFSLTESERRKRDDHLLEYLYSKKTQGAGLRKLAHPVSMLVTILSKEEREHLAKVTEYVYSGVQVVRAGSLEDGVAATKRGDYATALKLLRPLAEQGDAGAQLGLGSIYAEGQGVVQDHKEAVKWFSKAAEQGFSMAQFNLGVMYEKGHGVAQDHKEAVNWYRKAAEQGHWKAQYNLGGMYYNGQGVAQDHKEAAQWYRKAAEQGYASAQYNLGTMYAEGLGVVHDHKEAVKWFRKAAEQGHAVAQSFLGMMD